MVGFRPVCSLPLCLQVWKGSVADPPLDANIVCRLPKALFDEQTHLQDALNKLLRGIQDYRELLDGQLVETKLDYPGKTIIQHLPPTLGAESQKPEQQERRKKRSFFTGFYNFFFGNQDAVIENLQNDFSRLQSNFKTIVTEEHRSFKELVQDNQQLEESINSLKLQEIADYKASRRCFSSC